MQILRTILIILLFYYGFKFLFKVLAPFLLTRWVNKKTQQFQQQQQHQFQDEERARAFAKQKEGEIKIKTTKTNKPETEGLGDYVDYEEVKE